jgi:hypothetical protein
MSDIYLQITETPTVVTLSAPVVSGALAATVTVANVVTVALDSNSLSALENVTVTVGAAITGTVTVGNSVTIGSLPAISGTVTANAGANFAGEIYNGIFNFSHNNQMGVYVTDPLPTGTNSIGRVTVAGTVTIGAGTAQIGSVTISSLPNVKIQGFNAVGGGQYIDIGVTEQGAVAVVLDSALPAGTEQIGSVTASISGTVPISISSVTVGNSVTIGSLPAISGTVTANTFALQGTAVTTSNFTSTTASTVLANYNATREVLTIFNEGAGNLFVCAGATCTTVQYQVRLLPGDYYEAPNHQTTMTHSAVFATAGTARVTQIS